MSCSEWMRVRKGEPCEVCGKDRWCFKNADGAIGCMFSDGSSHNGIEPIQKRGKDGQLFWLYAPVRCKAPDISYPEPAVQISDAIADPDTLDNVYGELLSHCRPDVTTITHLCAQRRLPHEVGEYLGSTLGLLRRGRIRLAYQLVAAGHEESIAHVPGFYVDNRNGRPRWNIAGASGLMIPVRDVDGRIVAISIRADSQNNGSSRYSWLTSSTRDRGGSSPGSPIHVPVFAGDKSTIRVTEGALKAELATLLSDTLTLGLPGVGTWGTAKTVIDALNPERLQIAFDADHLTNKRVKAALHEFVESARDWGTEVLVELWPLESGKGIDDILAAGGKTNLVPADRFLESASKPKEQEKNERGPSQATILVTLAQASDAEWFHSPGGEPDGFVTVCVEGRYETWRIGTKAFRYWLQRLYWQQTKGAPNSQAMQDAIGVLRGRALFDGPEHSVAVRLAEHDSAIWLDLANEQWQSLRIDSSGWTVENRSRVRFMRPRGVLSLPLPERGGSIEELQPFLNVDSDDDWLLILSWLIAAMRPRGPYPVLALYGEQGSAKTSACRILRTLIDPNLANQRSEPREPRDLMIAATNSWIVSLENLSSIPLWLSDALCRLATGGGYATRELYTDDEERLFDVKRPIIVNGITEVATRPDLLDRTIAISLPVMDDDKRRTESDLYGAFDRAKPRILGALLDAVSAAIRNLAKVQIDRLPRMADFGQWACAAAPALGADQEAFLSAYSGNRENVNQTAIESSIIAEPLLLFLEGKDGWEGTATKLKIDVEDTSPEKIVKHKAWPKRPHTFSGELRRIAPNLRRMGIDIDFQRGDHRLICITRTSGKSSVGSVGSVGKPKNKAFATDATSSGKRREASGAMDKNRGKNAVPDATDAPDAESATCSDEWGEL